jgi:hypothetical protein
MTQKQIEARQRLNQMFGSAKKIKEAKKQYSKRKNTEYKRNRYREVHGIPLNAPVMTRAEAIAKARNARWKKKEAQP